MVSFSKFFTQSLRSSSSPSSSSSSRDPSSLSSSDCVPSSRTSNDDSSSRPLSNVVDEQPLSFKPISIKTTSTITQNQLPSYTGDPTPPAYAPAQVIRRVVAPKENPYVTYQRILAASSKRGVLP